MKRYFLSVFLFALIISSTSYSQPTGSSDVSLGFSTNYEHGFDTDIDAGGEISFNRYSISGSIGKQINERTSLDFNSSYSFTDYEFSGTEGFAGLNPWEGINRASFGFKLNYRLNAKWGITAGPFIRYSGESDADFGDSLTYGGLIGFSYSPNRNFLIGSGVFISSRIEDDVIAFPGLILNWRINDKATLSTLLTGVKSEIGPNVSFKYEIGNGLDASMSVGYEFQRFRLDDSGIAPDGVGDAQVLPVWASIGYDINQNLRFEIYSGLGFLGELELEDSDGDRIDKEDFDTMVFIGTGIKLNL